MADARVVQRTLCLACNSMASARRANGLWNRSWKRQVAYSACRSKPTLKKLCPRMSWTARKRSKAPPGVHHWMESVAIGSRNCDLQESVAFHRNDQRVSGLVCHFACGEDDTHRVATRRRRECGEELIGFKGKLLIARHEWGTRTARTVEVRSRNLMGELRVHENPSIRWLSPHDQWLAAPKP